MLAAGIFAASAAETTIDFAAQGWDNAQAVTSATADPISITVSQNDGKTAPAYYTSGSALRMYSGNSISFAAPAGTTITKIDMVLASQTYAFADSDGYTATSGTFTADPKTARAATWTGSAESLEITIKNQQNSDPKPAWPQFRICSLTITYNAGVETKCATPKFSLKDGKYYTAQEVELTASTEGSKIVYTINGGAETEYTAPIQLTAVGTYAISAYAKKAGLENSDAAAASYEIAEPIAVGSLDEFIMNGESEDAGTAFKWTFPVTVTAQMPGNLYVKDNNGGVMLIYGNEIPTYKTGDVIPAGIVGNYKNYNGLYEMEFPEASTFAPSTEKKAVSPIIMKAGEITADDQNKVICIANATYTEVKDSNDKVTSKTMDDETGSVNVFYQKAWEIENGVSGTKYDLLCAVAVYNKNGSEIVQVYPMAFTAPGSGVENATADNTVIHAIEGAVEVVAEGNVTVFNAAGQIVASRNVNGAATINVAAGFYIVRAGNTVAKVIVK